MKGNFDIKALAAGLGNGNTRLLQEPRILLRVILGMLLLANVAAALALLQPWSPSPEQLEEQLGRLRSESRQKTQSVQRLRTLVEKSRTARRQGDAFLARYFMDRRTASSTILTELKEAATKAGIKQQEHSFSFEPIEGSDELSMMTISGNYEGRYVDLVKFINLLDRSPKFLILDTLTASPERAEEGLRMNFKMNAFVIDSPDATPAVEAAGQDTGKTDSGQAGTGNEPPKPAAATRKIAK